MIGLRNTVRCVRSLRLPQVSRGARKHVSRREMRVPCVVHDASVTRDSMSVLGTMKITLLISSPQTSSLGEHASPLQLPLVVTSMFSAV